MNICKLPEGFRWSFSKLESYEHCPMMFKLAYIDNVKEQGNGFSDFGTLCHEILEGWANGSIPFFAMAEEYESRYDKAVVNPFPPFPRGMANKYYEQGLAYFENFDEFDGKYDILEVEDKFTFEIDGYTFVGIADLIVRNRETGRIEVIDHKSKSMATMKKDLPTFRKQLYIYAHHVKLKYGEFPDKLMFNMFRENEWVIESFDEQTYHDTLAWITETIHKIEAEKEWKVCSSSYFCRFVCGTIEDCPIRDAILYSNTKKKEVT